MESLESMQLELKKAKAVKKEEDATVGSVFDHTASSLIQPAVGSVLVQHEAVKAKQV